MRLTIDKLMHFLVMNTPVLQKIPNHSSRPFHVECGFRCVSLLSNLYFIVGLVEGNVIGGVFFLKLGVEGGVSLPV